MRGEQLSAAPRPPRVRGSPPLARGTAIFSPRQSNGAGITPACAGNSKRGEKRVETHRDHPRLRGEQRACGRIAGYAHGSPPLARGTATLATSLVTQLRITPACAGNRNNIIPLSPKGEDHPRLRGEQYCTPAVSKASQGSPPLARGTDYNL